jgi:hypothetical protein
LRRFGECLHRLAEEFVSSDQRPFVEQVFHTVQCDVG